VRAHAPSTGSPSTSFGPVQPFGVTSTIIGQRGRSPAPPALIRAISSKTSSKAAAMRSCIARGSDPSTYTGRCP
jgi:hypothetical protein